MYVPGDTLTYSLKIVSLLLYSQLLSHEFNPLIKYSQAGVTSVILRVVVEEDIEGEEFGGFCF